LGISITNETVEKMKELIKLKKDELLLNQKRSFDVKSLNPYFLEIILNEKKRINEKYTFREEII